MNEYAAISPKKWVREEPTNRLRWKKGPAVTHFYSGAVTNEQTLQQAWKIENYIGDYIDTVEIQWCDVPTED